MFPMFHIPRAARSRTLVPQAGIEPVPSAVESWSLTYRTAREVSQDLHFLLLPYWPLGDTRKGAKAKRSYLLRLKIIKMTMIAKRSHARQWSKCFND